MRLSGFSLMSADAFSSDTSADSIPGSFIRATRTVWAQISQSMPRTFNCTWRSSAIAALGASNAIARHAAVILTIRITRLLFVQPEKITCVDYDSRVLARLAARLPLIDREQHAALEAILLVEQQGGRPDQQQPAPALGIDGARAPRGAIDLTG